MTNLGRLLWRTDAPTARRWLERAAGTGDPEATALYAQKIRFRHPRRAKILFDRAAAAGDPLAMTEVGHRIVNHHLLLIFRRPHSRHHRAAVDWLTRAADAGETNAMRELSSLLILSGDAAGGERWLQTATDAGKSSARLLLGLHQANLGAYEEANEAFVGRGRWWLPMFLGRGYVRLARRRSWGEPGERPGG